jgi:hypothetical protein
VAIAALFKFTLILKGPFALLAKVHGNGEQPIFHSFGERIIFRGDESAMATGEKDGDQFFENLMDGIPSGEIEAFAGIPGEPAVFAETQAAGDGCDRGRDPSVDL